MRFSAAPLILFSLLSGVRAGPFPRHLTVRQVDTVTALSTTQISDLAPFTQFARAAYCPPDEVLNWTCGEACEALKGFKPTLTGGDGDGVQFFFIGHWTDRNTIVVGHQGTDPTQLMALLTDLKLLRKPLDPALFPGIPEDASVHEGFRDQHAKTAPQILTEVQRLMAETGSKNVITIGHSLGGALAELQALFLSLNLPGDVVISSTTYGTPRVGDQEYVDFFESKITDFRRVNNGDDVVPIIPGRFLGFVHPKGEIHLIDEGKAVACPGNDDEDNEDCQIQTVPNVLAGNPLDHLGPYEGILIGTLFCH